MSLASVPFNSINSSQALVIALAVSVKARSQFWSQTVKPSQSPIPIVATDLASTAASTKGCGKPSFFPKNAHLFCWENAGNLFHLLILLILLATYFAYLFWNAGLCVGLSCSFLVLPPPSAAPSQLEDHVSPNTRQISARWSGGTQSCWPQHLQRLRCLRHELKHSDKHEK